MISNFIGVTSLLLRIWTLKHILWFLASRRFKLNMIITSSPSLSWSIITRNKSVFFLKLNLEQLLERRFRESWFAKKKYQMIMHLSARRGRKKLQQFLHENFVSICVIEMSLLFCLNSLNNYRSFFFSSKTRFNESKTILEKRHNGNNRVSTWYNNSNKLFHVNFNAMELHAHHRQNSG